MDSEIDPANGPDADELASLRTELLRARESIETLEARVAEKDTLLGINPDTGLPIFRMFYRDLEKLIEARRAGMVGGFAVVKIRLDSDYQRIKNFKDRSHALLFKTTIRIREVVGDTLYQSDRLDEFFLLMQDYGSETALRTTLRLMAREVAKPHEGVRERIVFGCLVGVSLCPEHGDSVVELLDSADIALRVGLQRHKGIVCYNHSIGLAWQRFNRIEQELRRASQTGFEDFRLVYQPFVDSSHTIRGCESLCRWNHPELGNVPPPQFIPIAERTGDIHFFGRWTLYKSCLQLKEWHDRGWPDLFVSVNLSPAQFTQRDLVERIGEIIQGTGIEGRHLKLEITEGAIMDDPEDTAKKLAELRAMGIRISIDDFGTGYSSFSYLARLPIDTLKIDKSFVDGVTDNPFSREIVRAIISMAGSLHIETLAEGVETLKQKDLIMAEGCKYIQGYFFSKPVSPDLFDRYLDAGGTLPLAEEPT